MKIWRSNMTAARYNLVCGQVMNRYTVISTSGQWLGVIASLTELQQHVPYMYTQGIMLKCFLFMPMCVVNIVTEFNTLYNLNFPTLLLKK